MTDLHKTEIKDTEDGPCKGPWLTASFWCVFGAMILFFGVIPLFVDMTAKGALSEMPEFLRMALATYPLQFALLAAVIIPARLWGGGQLLHLRLLVAPPTLKQILAMAALLCVLLPLLASVAWGFKNLLTAANVEFEGQLAVQAALHSSLEGFGVLAAGAVLLAPFAEEFAFRRVIFSFIRDIAGTFPAAVLSSAIFAFTHGSLLQLPSLFFLGLVLQFVCVRCNSLTPAIMLHMFINMASMSILFLMRQHAGL